MNKINTRNISIHSTRTMETLLRFIRNVLIANYYTYKTRGFFSVAARRRPKRTNGDPAMRRLRRSNSRKMAVARNGSVLAQRLPQVLVLWRGTGGNRPLVLHQERHDPLQKRLQKVRMHSCFKLARACIHSNGT